MAPEINRLLDVVIRENASDLHLAVGRPPVIRLHGQLRSLSLASLTADDTVAMMKSIASERHQQELAERGGSDFGFAYSEAARFRVSIFRERAHVGMVLRLIPSRLMTFEEIGLPPVVKDLCLRPRGMVLVTGPTGSGKTTTLATMIDFINTESACHIITIEDPIEYYHKHKKSLVTQREKNNDVLDFEEALWRALRMDPDVILVGEMRNTETISAAITAAETGHLVFGTLHTTGAAQTVDRIIDAFPVNQQNQIRAQLSVTLEAVLSQTLCAKMDGSGRVAAFELMFCTPAIRNLIRECKTFRIPSFIQTGAQQGMILLDDNLFGLWVRQQISFNEMIQHCQDAEAVQVKVREYTEELKNRESGRGRR
jgi:twitching motility protein PilT